MGEMDIVSQVIMNSIIAGSVYTLVAVGFNLTYGATKFFNITHGVMTAVGAYTVFFLGKLLGFPVWIAIITGVLFAGAVGWLLDRFIYRPLRAKKASQLALLVASLGAFTALQACIALAFTSQFQTVSDSDGPQTVFAIAGASVTQIQIVIILTAIAVTAGLALFLKHTRFGRAVRAVSDDEEVAKVVGINTDRVIGAVFCVASAIAGLAGILVGFDTAIEPTMGLALLLKGVTAAIVGGLAGVGGAALGSFLLGFVENFGVLIIAAEWKDAIAFGLLILFLIFRPGGIIKSS